MCLGKAQTQGTKIQSRESFIPCIDEEASSVHTSDDVLFVEGEKPVCMRRKLNWNTTLAKLSERSRENKDKDRTECLIRKVEFCHILVQSDITLSLLIVVGWIIQRSQAAMQDMMTRVTNQLSREYYLDDKNISIQETCRPAPGSR